LYSHYKHNKKSNGLLLVKQAKPNFDGSVFSVTCSEFGFFIFSRFVRPVYVVQDVKSTAVSGRRRLPA
ncbi:MAG: hypothetical protein RSB78_02715, partial [Oscillospiraceae bacterium]